MPIGSYATSDAGKIIDYEILVDSEDFYKLTIYDSAGNGFGGTLTVYEDANVDSMPLMKEPGFTSVSGTSVSHGFYVGSSPEQFLTLRFKFDYFAHEVAYELKNDNYGIIFALAWFQTFAVDEKEATVIIPIYGPEWGDQKYTLTLWDDGNDGMCCSWGDGGYKLYLGPLDDKNLLTSSEGKYGSGETFHFQIKATTPNPTPLPTTFNPTKQPTAPYPTYSPVTSIPLETHSETSIETESEQPYLADQQQSSRDDSGDQDIATNDILDTVDTSSAANDIDNADTSSASRSIMCRQGCWRCALPAVIASFSAWLLFIT